MPVSQNMLERKMTVQYHFIFQILRYPVSNGSYGTLHPLIGQTHIRMNCENGQYCFSCLFTHRNRKPLLFPYTDISATMVEASVFSY